jgi:hypothetical protein
MVARCGVPSYENFVDNLINLTKTNLELHRYDNGLYQFNSNTSFSSTETTLYMNEVYTEGMVKTENGGLTFWTPFPHYGNWRLDKVWQNNRGCATQGDVFRFIEDYTPNKLILRFLRCWTAEISMTNFREPTKKRAETFWGLDYDIAFLIRNDEGEIVFRFVLGTYKQLRTELIQFISKGNIV